MARTISGLSVRDIRTPTSRTLAGSDAVHTDPDYSATYVVLTTDARDGIEGHGMTFTLGRGNEVVVAAVRALQHLIVGSKYEDIVADLGASGSGSRSKASSDGSVRRKARFISRRRRS